MNHVHYQVPTEYFLPVVLWKYPSSRNKNISGHEAHLDKKQNTKIIRHICSIKQMHICQNTSHALEILSMLKGLFTRMVSI